MSVLNYNDSTQTFQLQKHNEMDGYTDPEYATLGAELGSSFSEKNIRMAFIGKVYSILMVQLAITVSFICLFLYCHPVRFYTIEHPEMVFVGFVISIVLIIAMAYCDNVRRTFPLNFICLFLFTIVESFLLGVVSSSYEADEVMWAAGISAFICLGLTVFAFQTKYDFTIMDGMLFVSLLIFVCFGFLAIFLYNDIARLLCACIGALIFSLYLVFDTQLLIGGHHKYSISPEEYIFVALNLYLDIINLFLYILQIIKSIKSCEYCESPESPESRESRESPESPESRNNLLMVLNFCQILQNECCDFSD